MDNELLLIDRIGVIRDTIKDYGEENFYLSFSGGKDSTVLHYLLDMAIPGNKIPRVFINTGIEYSAIVEYVKVLARDDERIVIVKPSKNIKEVLETYGYPFKSKEHAKKVDQWQRHHIMTNYLIKYLDEEAKSKYKCPSILKYQFTDDSKIKISHLCCLKLKKEPVHKWAKDNKKPICITGIRSGEGGERSNIKGCAIFQNGKLKKYHPLLPTTDNWENWYIDQYNIKLCNLYYEPYNFKRTGCKGCPFALTLQEQLETMEKYLPAERKQCEYIWKPVYEEYRRLGYRLKKDEQLRLF